MAINFPNPATQTPVNTFSPTSSPSSTTNGVTYNYSNNKWVAQAGSGDGGTGSGAAVHYEGPTPPSTVTSNLTDQWYNTDDGRLYTLTENENGDKVWIDASPSGGSGGSGDEGGIEEAPSDGQQYARQNEGWSVVESGDVIYQGATAWVSFDGTNTTNVGGEDLCQINDSLNVRKVVRVAVGVYAIVYSTDMPNADYAINATASAALTNITSTDFKRIDSCRITVSSSGGVATDSVEVCVAVHSLNALPPRGGTGADAWGTFDGLGAAVGSLFNCTTSRTGVGTYSVTFNTPMPSNTYAVNCTAPAGLAMWLNTKTPNGFEIQTINSSNGVPNDYSGASFVVHATNAVLPETITEDQIAALIQNPVLSAWAHFDGGRGNTLGDLRGSFNVASVTRPPAPNNAAGFYRITWGTPFANTNYCLVGTPADSTENMDGGVQVIELTTTHADILVLRNDNEGFDPQQVNIQVAGTARNGTLGGGADSWVTSDGTGAIQSSFNVDSVTKVTTGTYQVNFDSPMPNTNYAVTVATRGSGNREWGVDNQTVNSYRVYCYKNAVLDDVGFSAVVHATDGNAGGFWVKTGDELAPLSATDSVSIGNGDITLNADGSAEFSGRVTVGDYRPFSFTPTGEGVGVFDSGVIELVRYNNGNAGEVFRVYNTTGTDIAPNTDPTVEISNDGRASFAETITSDQDDNTGHFFKGIAAGTTLFEVQSDGQLALRESNGTASIVLTGNDGSSQFTGDLSTASGTTLVLNRIVDGSWYHLGGFNNGSTTTVWSIGANGNARFTNTRSASVVLETETDNPANYTVEGEYTGPTLDVKERLMNVLSRLDAIEANEVIDDATDSSLLQLVASAAARLDSIEARLTALEGGN